MLDLNMKPTGWFQVSAQFYETSAATGPTPVVVE